MKNDMMAELLKELTATRDMGAESNVQILI